MLMQNSEGVKVARCVVIKAPIFDEHGFVDSIIIPFNSINSENKHDITTDITSYYKYWTGWCHDKQ